MNAVNLEWMQNPKYNTDERLAFYEACGPQPEEASYGPTMKSLQQMETEDGIVRSDDILETVSFSPLKKLITFALPWPVHEMPRADSILEISSFLRKERGVLYWQVEGQPLTLAYHNGFLIRAVGTEYDGQTGTDLTHAALKILGIPLQVPYQDFFEVDGIVSMRWIEFTQMNPHSDCTWLEIVADVVHSICRSLDAERCRTHGLHFQATGMAAAYAPACRSQAFDFLDMQGFDVVANACICEGLTRYQIKRIRTVWNPLKCQYPTSGLVFALDKCSELHTFQDALMLEHPDMGEMNNAMLLRTRLDLACASRLQR